MTENSDAIILTAEPELLEEILDLVNWDFAVPPSCEQIEQTLQLLESRPDRDHPTIQRCIAECREFLQGEPVELSDSEKAAVERCRTRGGKKPERYWALDEVVDEIHRNHLTGDELKRAQEDWARRRQGKSDDD